MPEIMEAQSTLLLVISLVCLVLKVYALVDCATRRPAAFDSMPKKSWLVILGLALVAHLLFFRPLMILNLLGTVAALVYLAQHRGSKVF